MTSTELADSSPAEVAAQQALEQVCECIRSGRNFKLEAGAGAGKTYSLVQALKLIVDEQGVELERNGQQVACITYTNVATDEIISRTDGHPAIYASTIHTFCWNLIKGFQSMLKEEIAKIDAWTEKLEEAGVEKVGARKINYDLGYRRVKEGELFLNHDDVITLTAVLMEKPKFRRVFSSRFPILFIDEYQDTNAKFADGIIEYFIDRDEGLLIGLFGDSWQKIYADGKGDIESENLHEIGKRANFRSVPEVVTGLNAIRFDLPQDVHDPKATGSVAVFHSNEWEGTRLTRGHWSGDLPAEDAHTCLGSLQEYLSSHGWDFSPECTKILMLTHNVLAAEQNYGQILKVFKYKESIIKKEDPHIAFLVDTIEPACTAFQGGRFGEMFKIIGARSVNITSLEDKTQWADSMNALVKLRQKGTIGEVLDHLKKTHRPRLPDAVKRIEDRLAGATAEQIKESQSLNEIKKLRIIPYKELISLALFVNNDTPFSTKHGVKGAEFDNVLVVFGRGWSHYNWNQFLEWFPDNYPEDKDNTYIRNRNLFYVSCSRAKKHLALLFTQELSKKALKTLRSWFGDENVRPFTPD